MKNIIAIASLLAAGTALANAAENTLPEPDWTALTLTTPSGNKLESGNSGFTWSDYSATSLTESWQLSFDWVSTNEVTTEKPAIDLFGTNGASNAGAQGIVLQWTSDNGGTLRFGTKGGSDGWAQLTNISLPSSAQTVVITYLKSADVSVASSILKLKFGDSTEATITAPTSNTTFLGNGGNTRLWTNGGKDTYSSIALSYGASVSPTIPEPSAFGLLAGAGALAFVAARRRRRAK